MNINFLGITLGAAHYSVALLGIAILTLLIVVKAYRLTLSVDQLAALKWQYILVPHYSRIKVIIKSFLLIIGCIAVCIALLRPQWGTKDEVVEQMGRELFIGLDISRSMLASDIKPHRLAFAKSKIRRLIKLLEAERVGLLVFSGDALLQCPLTRDTAAFNLFLDAVDAETISSGTTALDQALSKIISIFSSMPTCKDKVVVIFTDGEDFSSNLREVKEEAQKKGIHIFTYGVGTEQGAPVPVLNEEGKAIGHQKDAQGNVVISRLNPGILKALAQESGGLYIGPTQEDDDLYKLVDQVQKYEKQKFEDKEVSTKEERYYYFLGGAFLCFLIEWII